jgi:hypothetical protein
MTSHRLLGAALALVGLALLFGQLGLLYGSAENQARMVAIGLPGVAVLTTTGAVCFACGCLMAAAPKTNLHHARRAANILRRRGGA